MPIIIFLIILAILVLVHELGHFLTAKFFGIRVDEFGIGFPPRLWSFKKGETVYSINLLPLGGFVKIFGENYDEADKVGKDKGRSFVEKPKWVQTIVLAAGVTCNVLLAWLAISAGFISGLPVSTDYGSTYKVQDAHIVVTSILSKSPAEESGLKAGDTILFIESKGTGLQGEDLNVDKIYDLIAKSEGEKITILLKRGSDNSTVNLEAKQGVVAGKYAIGVTMANVGILSLPPHLALIEGFKFTYRMTIDTAVGLYQFLSQAVIGKANLSQVSGPVGIVSLVGDATRLGFAYLINLTAIISINLAIINLLPMPALDGGRILFVLIEAIKRKPINPNVAQTVNAIGFALLLLLMVVITYNDIIKLVIK
ncbi:MAG: site-2 protease family protein [Candidatus Paceibacterota bacterium]